MQLRPEHGADEAFDENRAARNASTAPRTG